MISIEELFPEGEWKTTEEFVVKCPLCGDHATHNHCYLNFEKHVFVCQFCGGAGTLNKLWRLMEIYEEVDVQPNSFFKVKKSNGFNLNDYPKVTGLDTKHVMDKVAYDYLVGRGFDRKTILEYDIRYADFGKYFGRILVPIYEDGVLVCFVSRTVIETNKAPKYLFPSKGETKKTTSECVFNYDRAFKEDYIFIVEGIFDCLNIQKITKFGCVALFTKRMSDVQLSKFLDFPKNKKLVVMLDGDAKIDGLTLAKKLYDYGMKTYIVFLEEDNDPGSLLTFDYKIYKFTLELWVGVCLGEGV